MPRNVVATSKERTMQTSRPYNLPKNQKANDNPKQNTFGKPPAACSNKLFANKTFLQAAREHCLQTLFCCKVHSTFAATQKPRATMRQDYARRNQ